MTMVNRGADIRLQQDVLEELAWDPHVADTELSVEIDNGVVTLTGTVTSWAERAAAQEAARRVVGVLDVANDIRVRPPGGLYPTDTEIAQAVRRALEWDVFVEHERIRSTVTDGCVILEGTVDRLSQRDDAERAVRNLRGVINVLNKIIVTTPTSTSESVARAIERALERRAERHARRIGVDVHDGIATLTGSVYSWSERRSVLGAARSTPGVRAVEDRLWPEE
jgi:osmotically-inducible protein OsmY